MEKYKVIILGAGVAGLSAYLYLKRFGIEDVLVIDKNNHSIHKSCSGMLTTKSINLLKELNIDLSIYQKTKEINAFYNNANKIKFNQKDVYLYLNNNLNRIPLDEILYKQCIDNKINIIEDVNEYKIDKNKINIQDKEYYFDYLIDARGFAYISSLQKEKIFGIEAKLTINNQNIKDITCDIYLDSFTKGYKWICKHDKYVTVGFTDLYKKDFDYKNKLFEFIKQNNLPIDNITDLRGAFVPIKPIKKVVMQNILLIGERAGLTDPLTQEGIYYAINSAKQAAISINKGNINLYKKLIKDNQKSLFRAYRARSYFFKSSFQEKLWNIALKHNFTTFLFSLYSSSINFDYRNLIKYHKEYKKWSSQENASKNS